MNYKGLFKRIGLLIMHPDRAWEEINNEKSVESMYSTFSYPLIALTSLCVFIAGLIYATSESPYPIFQEALTTACVYAISLFGGLFISIFLVSLFFQKKIVVGDIKLNKLKLTQLVGYSFIIVFLYFILSSLLPSLSKILLIPQVYIIYIIWQGLDFLVPKNYEYKMRMAFIASGIIVIVPIILKIIFSMLVKL